MHVAPTPSLATIPATIDARRLATSMVALVITLSAAKALAVYSGVANAVFLIPALVLAWLWLRTPGRDWVPHAAIAVTALVVLAFACNVLPDPTWDGNMYHKAAMSGLHDGWNPWRFPEFGDWIKTRSELYYSPSVWNGNQNATWVSHYPNLSWLFGAALMDFGFGIESGKALSGLLAVALGCQAYATLQQYAPHRLATIGLTLATVLCAPLMTQLTNNYVDGATYSAVALVILSLLDRADTRRGNVVVWGSLVILAGLKFTGALYAAMLALPFLALKRPSIPQVLAWALVGALTLSHPYLNHLVSGKEIAYPVTSSNLVLRSQVEPRVLEAPRVLSLTASLFARTSNSLTFPGVKIPGKVNGDEMLSLGGPDARFAGFGPWFSLALLLSAAALACGVYADARCKAWRGPRVSLLLMSVLLVIMALLHTAPWWARYVPFLQLAMVLVLLYAWMSPLRVARVAAATACIALLVNGALVASSALLYSRDYAYRAGFSADRAIVSTLAHGDRVTVRAPQFVAFAALHHAEHDLGLPQLSYEAVTLDALNCDDRKEIGNWISLARVCVQAEPEPVAAAPAPSP
ncbi:hypothetical protein WG628_01185 [Stenotrophomonas maltophilia]